MTEISRIYVREVGRLMVVLTRIYETGDDGRRRLLYRPGDLISDADAARLARPGADSPHNAPGPVDVLRSLEGRDEDPPTATPAKPLERMTLRELRGVCAAEDIDPTGATLRADFIAAIEAARAATDTKPKG